ncbi:MAG: hypothetical protein IJF27_02595 [Oscillospiraceae bacterium]|nr:hypothetical protein [Oscillospiraceae bacterium]
MKHLSKILLCLSLAFLLVAAWFISHALYNNAKLHNEFKPKHKAYPYAEALKNGELSLKSVSSAILTDEIGLSGSSADRYRFIASPITIKYYSKPGDITPVFTIEKGTMINYQKQPGKSSVTYHGFESLPSDRHGWRLAKPFIVEGEEPNDTLLYVKTSDLEAVSAVWLKEMIPFIESITEHITTGVEQTRKHLQQKYVKSLLFDFDEWLYYKGIYISPDLLTPVFSFKTIASLAGSLVSFAAFIAVRRKYPLFEGGFKAMSPLPKTLFCFFAASAAVTACLLFWWLTYYDVLINVFNVPAIYNFNRDDNAFHYAEAIDAKDLDIEAISQDALAAASNPDEIYVTTPPIVISYYANINDTAPVYTIPMKARVLYEINAYGRTAKYHGMQSLPTNTLGWRRAKPFIIYNKEPDDTFFYVKTSDLAAVAAERYLKDSFSDPSNLYELLKKWQILRGTAMYHTLYIDRMLYVRNIFLSPDLAAFIFPPAPFISLAVSIVLLAAYLIVRRKPKIKHKNA